MSAGPGAAPANVSSRRTWRSRLGYASLGLLLLALVVSSVLGFLAYADHDRIELFDTPVVAERTEAACARLAQDLITAAQSPAQEVRAGNRAIDALIEEVRALGPAALDDDLPAADWLDDWAMLRDARADLNQRRATDSTARGVVPQTEDGHPVTERMVYAAGPECEQAVQSAATPLGP